MTPGARVAATIELLDEIVSRSERPADLVANAYFRSRRFIGGGDRRAVSERVWSLLRRYGQLTWWLERTRHPDRSARAIVAADLILVEGNNLAQLAAMFDGGRYRPQPLDEAELRALRQMEGHSLPHPEQPDWVRLNVQEWVAPHLIEAYGESWGREIAALETPPPVDLRVNQLKATVEQAQAALAREGIDTEPMRYAPYGLRLTRRLSVVSGEAFQNGLVEIQDEGSQLVAALVDAKPGIGTWRRNPAGRWTLQPKALAELVPKQAEILDAAARLVKPGGGLIYATCSVLPAENEHQIAAFLERHPDFETVPAGDIWRDVLASEPPPEMAASPYLRLSPLKHGTDGFFAATLVRKPEEKKEEAKKEEEAPQETEA